MTDLLKELLNREEFQKWIEAEDWLRMFENCIPRLRSELVAVLMDAGLDEPWNACNKVYRYMFNSFANVHAPLEEVRLRKKNVELENACFQNAPIKTITFNGTTCNVPELTFAGSSVEYVFGLRAPEIGQNAFNGCSHLVNYDGMGKATVIGTSAFSDCTALESVDLMNSPSILTSAFRKCYSLTSLQTNAYCIQAYAFAGCTALSEIIIENPNILLGSRVFDMCPATSIKFTGTTADWYACNKKTDWAAGSSITEVICKNGKVKVKQ